MEQYEQFGLGFCSKRYRVGKPGVTDAGPEKSSVEAAREGREVSWGGMWFDSA